MHYEFENLDARAGKFLQQAAETLSERVARINLVTKFAKALSHEVDMGKVSYDLSHDDYEFRTSWYWDGFCVGRKLLPVIRRMTKSSFKEEWVTTLSRDALEVTVKVEDGDYKGLKFVYQKPAPTTGDCTVEEVEIPATTRFELVCNKD